MEERVYVYFDDESVEEAQMMGTLTATHLRGKEVFSFEYEDGWLQKTAIFGLPNFPVAKIGEMLAHGKLRAWNWQECRASLYLPFSLKNLGVTTILSLPGALTGLKPGNAVISLQQ